MSRPNMREEESEVVTLTEKVSSESVLTEKTKESKYVDPAVKEYMTSWVRGGYTDDIQHLVGTEKCTVGTEEYSEKIAFCLMKYRQVVGHYSSIAEMNAARSLRQYNLFFVDLDENAKSIFKVPVSSRETFSASQWEKTLGDRAALSAGRQVSIEYYDELRYSQIPERRDEWESRVWRRSHVHPNVYFPLDHSTWWLTRIRTLDEHDLSPNEAIVINSLRGHERSRKADSFKRSLRKSLMILYNQEKYDAIEQRMTRFPFSSE